MESGTVFAKTRKGEEEVERRTHGLDITRRRALIMVNGKSDVATLVRNGAGLAELEESLSWLAQEGFIEERDTMKSRLIRMAEETLGSDGEKVIRKIREAPDTPEGLKAAAEGCKKIVKLTISEKKAAELLEKCQKILDGG